MTKELYEAHIPVGALKHEAYTIAEIDDHPNADRIWASIKLVREDAFEEGRKDGYTSGYSEGRDYEC